MSLIRAQNLCLNLSDSPQLDQASFAIEKYQHIAIIGRNGCGKSTLLKVIAAEIKVDSGQLDRQTDLSIASLIQEVPRNLKGNTFDFVCSGRAAAHAEDELWKYKHLAENILSRMGLATDSDLQSLSGGKIRRVLLAHALVSDPDILLLDEPTNHLDMEAIIWLEEYLIARKKTVIFITHDRQFLTNVASDIFELDRGHLSTWHGSYDKFLTFKEQQLAAEETASQLFDKKLAEEERWIRQGIKARRTRNEGRVRSLKKMRQERAERRQQQGQIVLQNTTAKSSAKQLFDIEHLCIVRDGKTLIKDFSSTILRGDKIGIIGANGCGKSTFIDTLIGSLQPTSGTIKRAQPLDIAYFDQHRLQLDLEATALDTVAEGRQSVSINGTEKHIISYLQDFLFSAEKARSKVRVLSGGERNRLLLAKILSFEHQLLIMDEPSNDLDMETLELLEDYLLNYQGTLLLISHDRSLLDNVITSSLVFEKDSQLGQYVGGYEDYKRQSSIDNDQHKNDDSKLKKKQSPGDYKVRKKSEKMLRQIDKLETEIKNIHQRMQEEGYYDKSQEIVDEDLLLLQQKQQQCDDLYAKWESLEEK